MVMKLVNTTELKNGDHIVYAGVVFKLKEGRPCPTGKGDVQFKAEFVRETKGVICPPEHKLDFNIGGNERGEWVKVDPSFGSNVANGEGVEVLTVDEYVKRMSVGWKIDTFHAVRLMGLRYDAEKLANEFPNGLKVVS